jgi:hypothetical protein
MVTQNTMHKQERNKGAIDEILTELLIFDDQPHPVEQYSKPKLILVDIPSETKAVAEKLIE